MPTNYIRANQNILGRVGTTRLLTIATSPATQVVLGTGNSAIRVFNHGSGSIIWGDSSIAVNSGSYLFVSAAKEWGIDGSTLGFGWSVYLRAESVASLVSIAEYANG